MDFLQQAAEAVGMGDLAEVVLEGADLGNMFEKILEESVGQVLEFMGPKAGEAAVDRMKEKYPQLESVESLAETAVNAAVDIITGLKDEIFEFCQDIIELMQDGLDSVQAGIETFHKVLTMILRALRSAVQAAFDAIVGMMPGCCSCIMNMFMDIAELIASAFNSLVEMVEEMMRNKLKDRHVPQFLLDKIDFNASPDDDVGEPLKRRPREDRERREEEAPEQEGMDGAMGGALGGAALGAAGGAGAVAFAEGGEEEEAPPEEEEAPPEEEEAPEEEPREEAQEEEA
mmetsp:Transcript_71255/g.201985  ORF Transcript_71255/g.201985 Transcript_71255/m.201985 type:complete len:287 (+) Transcript_71255:106-966(+)